MSILCLLVTTAYAQSATQTWKYDADGNVIQTTTPNGRTIDYAVDALNRTTSETVSSPQPGEIAAVAYQHDGNGNVTQIKEKVGGATRTATRTYDTFDRLNTAQDVHGKTLVYAYDAVGNRLSVTDTSDSNNPQAVTAWTYNALNQNDSVTADNAGTSISYFPSGLIHVLTRPDGSTSTTEYDAAGRIASVVHHSSANAEIAHERYDYDLDGNRWHQYENNGPLTNGEQTTTYSYDKADRLTDVQTPDRTTHYVLDPAGNRSTEQIKDATQALIGNSTLAYNEREQLISRSDSVTGLNVNLTWDADGNTQTETDSTGTRTYAYDAHDRAIQITPAGSGAIPIAMDYQSDGLRIGKHQGAAETRYEYDENSLLAETNAIGNVLVRYHYSASQLLSRTETSGATHTRHYLDDALNTPIATLNQGAIDSRTKYDAWGEVISQQGIGGGITQASTDGTNAELLTTDNQAIGFTGYLKDQETGLYYAKARYYDPRIARFTTEDPEEGNAMQPPSLHRYLYAYANPTVYTDPTGRLSEGDDATALRLAAAFARNDQDRVTMEHVIALNQHENAKTGAGILGSYSTIAQGIFGGVQLASDALSGAAISDAIDQRFGAQPTGAAARAQALGQFVAHPINTFRQSIAQPLQAASDAAAQGDDIGQSYYEGEALGNFVNAAMGARGLVGMARGAAAEMGTLAQQGRAVTITEGASGEVRATPFNPEGEKPLAEYFDDPRAGHSEASGRVPGGNGRAIAGHGEQNYPIRETTTPEGTAVTTLRQGVEVDDDIGRMMERGDWDSLRDVLNNESSAAALRRADQVRGMRTYPPGVSMPDYTVMPPGPVRPLEIHEESVTVGQATRLSKILQPNQGCIVLTTCTVLHDVER